MRKLSAIALVAAFVVAACGGGGTGGGSTTASGSAGTAVNVPDSILLGASLPLTGADSTPGKFMKDAYELYIKQVNDAGGLSVGGKKVKIDLKIEDNKGDAGHERPALREAHHPGQRRPPARWLQHHDRRPKR